MCTLNKLFKNNLLIITKSHDQIAQISLVYSLSHYLLVFQKKKHRR